MQANSKLCDILGYSLDELLETDFQSITHPDDAAVDRHYYQALLAGEIVTTSFEKRYLRKDGEAVWCSVTPSMIRNQQQQPSYFIAFIEDISDRKQFELELAHQRDELVKSNLLLAQATTRLERQNRDLDDFAYVTSHDLKAPLRAIGNIATWLEEDLGHDLPDDNRQQLELLQGRVRRMENLIDGLLAYSRAGRGQQKMEWVDLNLLLSGIVDLLAPPQGFRVELPPQLPSLWTNRAALMLVFSNLIGNGIKHNAAPTGWVKVRCEERRDQAYEFTITDNGPGIEPAYHQKIFEIFQVLEPRDEVENTGIGLSIVKKTIEAVNGTITVESAMGQGTTFRVVWPQEPHSGGQD